MTRTMPAASPNALPSAGAVKADAHGRKVGSTTVVPPHGLAWLRTRFIKRRHPQEALFEIGGES